MPESSELLKKSLKGLVKETTSEAFDPSNYALGKKKRHWEQYALSLPVYRGDNAPPLQRPDGSFPFTLGYHTLGEATL